MGVIRPHGSLITGLKVARVFNIFRNKLAELAVQTLVNGSPPRKGVVHSGTLIASKFYNIA
jgi:hypothetical protein